MKIALVSRITGWHRPSGLGHVVQTRAEALAAAGHEVHVLTAPIGKSPDSIAVSSADAAAGSIQWNGCGIEPKYSDRFAEDCKRAVQRIQPDVIHLESFDRHRRWWEDVDIPTHTSLHGEDITCWFTEYRLWLHGKANACTIDTKRIREQINAMRGFDTVIATAIFDEWAFRDLLGFPRVRLVYNPIPDYFFENRTEATDGPAGFFALWGDNERGCDVALKASELAGVSLLRPKNRPRTELPKLYDQCRCLLLPSYQSNGFDLSVEEALARGRTVITSTSGLWWFESRHCPAIKCFDPSDVEGIAEAVRSDWQFPETDFADEFRASRHVERWLSAVS